MRTVLFVVCAVFLFGCSSADVEGVVEQSQAPLVTTVSAINGTTNLPAASQYFCHPTRFLAAGAHAGSPVLPPWQVIERGADFGYDPNAISAIPYGGQGNARMDVQCDSWSNFHGNLTYAGLVGNYFLTWSPTGTISPVSGAVGAYYQDSPCWLSGVYGLSNGNSEKAWIDTTSNPGIYTLNAIGFRGLSAQTECAALGRPLTGQQWLTATTAQSPYSSYGSSTGICLIMSAEGNIDDGSITVWGGAQMRLAVTGGVSKATAMCFPY
jgi:hypothetical protein